MRTLAEIFYNVSPIIENDGEETWIVPWSDIEDNYPATHEAYMEAVAETQLKGVKDSILEAATFESNVIVDILWMIDERQGTVVDVLSFLLGEE